MYVRAHVNAEYLRTFYEVLNLIFFLLSRRIIFDIDIFFYFHSPIHSCIHIEQLYIQIVEIQY